MPFAEYAQAPLVERYRCLSKQYTHAVREIIQDAEYQHVKAGKSRSLERIGIGFLVRPYKHRDTLTEGVDTRIEGGKTYFDGLQPTRCGIVFNMLGYPQGDGFLLSHADRSLILRAGRQVSQLGNVAPLAQQVQEIAVSHRDNLAEGDYQSFLEQVARGCEVYFGDLKARR
ncbi:MAG: hypothetical protein ACOCWQ_01245 [Nanoarchaeota archaeon]